MSIVKDHRPTVGVALSLFVGANVQWAREDLVPWVAEWVPDDVAMSGWMLGYALVAAGIGWVVERGTVSTDKIDAETVLSKFHGAVEGDDVHG